MEEVLIFVLQLMVEVLVEVLVYLPFDLPLQRSEVTGERKGWGWGLVYLLLGGAVGGLSLLVAPRLLLHSAGARVANLLLAPLAAGGLSWGLAEFRRAGGAAVCPRTHFWTAFGFVFAFAGVRLAYAAH